MSIESRIKGLYAISDHEKQSDQYFLEDMEAALRGGASIIQLREKQSSEEQKHRRANELRALCKTHNALLFINDDPALCKSVQADGIHLGQNDSSIKEARRYLDKACLIGVSCHGSTTLARRATQEGADYLALGRFFPSQTKPQAPAAHIECIQAVRQYSSLPLVAIGGITLDNAITLLNEGANALALIHDLWSSKNIQQHAQAYCQLFNHRKSNHV